MEEKLTLQREGESESKAETEKRKKEIILFETGLQPKTFAEAKAKPKRYEETNDSAPTIMEPEKRGIPIKSTSSNTISNSSSSNVVPPRSPIQGNKPSSDPHSITKPNNSTSSSTLSTTSPTKTSHVGSQSTTSVSNNSAKPTSINVNSNSTTTNPVQQVQAPQGQVPTRSSIKHSEAGKRRESTAASNSPIARVTVEKNYQAKTSEQSRCNDMVRENVLKASQEITKFINICKQEFSE